MKRTLAPLLVGLTACGSISAETDFNVVGKQVAIMLQNNHYQRLPLDEKLSQRIFDDFLKQLDYNRIYFTQEDVDALSAKYRDTLCDIILRSESMPVANEMYDLLIKRATARISEAQQMLKEKAFTFTGDEEVMRDRKAAAWPKDEAAAKANFKQVVKKRLLDEVIRRTLIQHKAEEAGRPELAKFDRSAEEKISLLYERIIQTLTNVDKEDVANYFLSVVCLAHGPHTDYVSAREMDRFRTQMANRFMGIGAQLSTEDDGATIIKGIVVGGPADRQGELKLNDRIVGVAPLNNGESDMVDILFMKLDKVVELIRGEEGTQVGLLVEPAGGVPGETKVIEITRAPVQMKAQLASAELIEQKDENGDIKRIGIITLPSFYGDLDDVSKRCSRDMEKLLTRLMNEKIDGLILDMRSNGGGYLDEVRRMTGFFVDRGPVVQVRNTRGAIDVKSSSKRRALYTGPLVMLIDRNSASATEILAGALQDYNRAVIVGDGATFGKGTVQQHMDIARKMPFLADSRRAGFLKPTIQKFYRVAGSSTQLKGVVPDITLPTLMDALEVGEKYLPHALEHDVIREAPGFEPLDDRLLFGPTLIEKSESRIAANKDFEYIRQDIERFRKLKEENKVSLNLEKRLAELKLDEERDKVRKKERVKRFAEIVEEDNKMFTIYRLNLDDLDRDELEKVDLKKDAESYMRMAKEELDELDDTPEWPNGLDPNKRESLTIATDLISLTEKAKVAGLFKND